MLTSLNYPPVLIPFTCREDYDYMHAYMYPFINCPSAEVVYAMDLKYRGYKFVSTLSSFVVKVYFPG